MQHAETYFSDRYAQARSRFLAAAEACGAEVTTYAHPLKGREGEDLAMELARIGPAHATKALLILSGTHGIEGYCGSGTQSAWLSEGAWKKRSEDTAIFLVHAVNPYGFSWQRRVNEDNVDLNRNFVDFAQPLPANPGYAELVAALCPKTWDEETQRAGQIALDAYAAKHGAAAMIQAVSGGQYEFPEGIFYGGQAPSWSRRSLFDILDRHFMQVRTLAVVDLHTGLGPKGYGERICDAKRGSKERTWTEELYGDDITCFYDGTSVSAEIQGDILIGVTRALPQALVSAVALEFGTVPREEVRLANRADNWLHLYGDVTSERGQAIKAQIRDAFYPKSAPWCEKVTQRAFETFDLALNALKDA